MYRPNYRNDNTGAFDLEIDLPEGWEDDSYRNDSCPSFLVGERLKVYVDALNPEDRENGNDWPRFTVYKLDDEDQLDYDAEPASFDSWEDVFAYLESLK